MDYLRGNMRYTWKIESDICATKILNGETQQKKFDRSRANCFRNQVLSNWRKVVRPLTVSTNDKYVVDKIDRRLDWYILIRIPKRERTSEIYDNFLLINLYRLDSSTSGCIIEINLGNLTECTYQDVIAIDYWW